MSDNIPEILQDGFKNVISEVAAIKTKSAEQLGEVDERLNAIEKRLSKGLSFGGAETKSLGATILDSEQCKAFYSQGQARSGRIPVGGSLFQKTAIVSSGDLFSQAQRVSPISAGYERLTVRDLLRVSPTSSNSVEFVRETSAGTTNAAAPQGKGSSPQVYENVAKAESALAFELIPRPIQTLAHWIPASRQVLDDSAMLKSFIDGRMIYFLKVVEEDQLLNGTGSGGELYGITAEATAFDSADVGDHQLDTLRGAIKQVQVSGFNPNGVVLNAADWANIELLKSTTDEVYLASNPRVANQPTIWGVNVVISNAMDSGKFLVGDFQQGAELFDRQQASIEISREHASFFTSNMVAILCEERIALATYQPNAFRYGAFAGS
jgi:HK97 family phage major capsid protein